MVKALGYARSRSESRTIADVARAGGLDLEHVVLDRGRLQDLAPAALATLEYLLHIARDRTLLVSDDAVIGDETFRDWLAAARRGPASGHWQQRWEDARAAWSRSSRWEQLDFPRVLSVCVWERQCFARCRFCPQVQHPGRLQNRTMDFGLFRHIIDQVPSDRRVDIRIGVDGESLSFPDLHRYVGYARQRLPRAFIEYATNGILLDGKRSRAVIESGLDHLMVSLNCPDRETYRWFTGPDAYQRVIRNLRQFQALKQQMGAPRPRLSAKIMTLQRWENQIDDALAGLAEIVDQALPSHVHYYDHGELENVADFQKPPSPLVPSCTYLSYILSVMPDGSCDVCCASNFFKSPHPDLGNLNTATISQVWNGAVYRQLRRTNARGKPVVDACRRCNVDLTEFVVDLQTKARQWAYLQD